MRKMIVLKRLAWLLLAGNAALAAPQPELAVTVTIETTTIGPTIDRHIFGQFAEVPQPPGFGARQVSGGGADYLIE